MIEKQNILNKTYQFAEAYHSHDNSGHDFGHIKRVYANMNMLLENEPQADAFICKISALLHDVDDHKMNTDGKVAERFLQSLDIDQDTISTILETINAISFSKSGANPKFQTLEMKLLSDADKLDAMGAIGLCRALNYGFSKNRPLFDENKFPSPENSNDHTINHFFAKLLLLKQAMQTDAGKKEAQQRHEFMIEFLQNFFAEQNLDVWQNFLKNYLTKTQS